MALATNIPWLNHLKGICIVYFYNYGFLHGMKKMVPGGGLEPPTRGFSIRCSTT